MGTAYAGAYTAFAEKQSIDTLQRVAGTSAGSIMACLIALKYTPAEITDIVNGTDFKSFESGFNPLRVLTKYGLYDGSAFLSWMERLIHNKTGKQQATFKDFHDLGYLDLNVFATNLNTNDVVRFCYTLTPNVVVSEAVRASMSIPMFFEAFQITGGDGSVLVDGGTVWNYPLTAFDKECPEEETLGFYLADIHNVRPRNDLRFDEPRKYIQQLIDTALDAQDIDVMNDVDILKRTILIDNLGISAIDFSITSDQKTALFNSGVKAASSYFPS